MTDDNLDDVQKKVTLGVKYCISCDTDYVGEFPCKKCYPDGVGEQTPALQFETERQWKLSKKLADRIDAKYDRLFGRQWKPLSSYANQIQSDDMAYRKMAKSERPNSVGKPISDMSVLEKEVRNKTLDDCIEKMERAIEAIRRMKT